MIATGWCPGGAQVVLSRAAVPSSHDRRQRQQLAASLPPPHAYRTNEERSQRGGDRRAENASKAPAAHAGAAPRLHFSVVDVTQMRLRDAMTSNTYVVMSSDAAMDGTPTPGLAGHMHGHT